MPLLFIGHGSPMNAIQHNEFTSDLRAAAKILPRPESILVVSAHWQTNGTRVTSGADPEQIFDFYGFPDELYSINYQPAGSPSSASLAAGTIRSVKVELDQYRGIDHGAWTVLMHLFPDQDIPVIQLSLDIKATPDIHYQIGSELSSLRDRGVMVIGSGNIVHNLVVMDEYPWIEPRDWAVEFDERVGSNLLNGKDDELIGYEKWGRISHYAVPTDEHYIPMLYVLGMRREGEKVEFIHNSFQHGTISMRSFIIR